jgi:uncharacterized membrane protein
MIFGVLSGLFAAFFQSCSYLFSKRYVARYEQSTTGLLVCGHVIMGAFSLLLLPFLWPSHMPGIAQFALPLAGCVVCYLSGQVFLFLSFKETDASRVSPLLGLKIMILAALTVIFTNQHFHPLQWLAIAIGVCAAYILGMLGREMTLKNWLWVVLACLCYSLSDLSIKVIIGMFKDVGLFHAAVFCACLCYFFCGVASGLALLFFPLPSFPKWKASFPFAVFWFAGILFLFACFGSIGVVFGNIVQSTRGVISILMGSLVAARGHEHIEEKVHPRVIVVRLCAAVLMIAAIVLFYAGQRG